MSGQGSLRVGVAGADGRMGRAVTAEMAGHPELTLAALLGRPASRKRGFVTPQAALRCCDVIIDFSTASASAELAALAAEAGGAALVIGSTGFSPIEEGRIAAASARVAIVKAGNFSLGAAVLAALAEEAARRLGAADWDIGIFEAHHRDKRDAPSGTALGLGEAAARGRGVSFPKTQAGTALEGRRGDGAIAYSVMRAGAIVGDHSVVFAADGEILTLSHSARDRRIFARGALTATVWVAGRPPGVYSMRDVLGP